MPNPPRRTPTPTSPIFSSKIPYHRTNLSPTCSHRTIICSTWMLGMRMRNIVRYASLCARPISSMRLVIESYMRARHLSPSPVPSICTRVVRMYSRSSISPITGIAKFAPYTLKEANKAKLARMLQIGRRRISKIIVL